MKSIQDVGEPDSSADRAIDPYIRIKALGKVFHSRRGDVEALRGIDLDIHTGEFLSVLGPSGCGKSTLLRCVSGLEMPTAGSVEVQGNTVDGPADDLGIVFQRDVLLDWLSALDNVLLTADFRHNDKRRFEPRARELLERLGLSGYENRYPWELSGGMRQRVAICRAILDDPALLLMDEPFGALDALTRDELNVELQRMWYDTRKTIMFITHSISESVFLSDRVVVMSRNPGEIHEILTIDLNRPRRLAIRETPEFGKYAAHIREIFEGFGVLKKEV